MNHADTPRQGRHAGSGSGNGGRGSGVGVPASGSRAPAPGSGGPASSLGSLGSSSANLGGPVPGSDILSSASGGLTEPGQTSLEFLIGRDGPVSPARTATIGLAVLDQIVTVHRRGAVHGDVRPASVLIGPGDRVLLAAPAVRSPSYTAPEGVTGPASDLWSLGATLYAAVEGYTPTPGAPMRNAGPIAPILVRLLSGDPTLRPDADAVRTALLEISPGRPGLPGLPGLPVPPAPSEPAPAALRPNATLTLPTSPEAVPEAAPLVGPRPFVPEIAAVAPPPAMPAPVLPALNSFASAPDVSAAPVPSAAPDVSAAPAPSTTRDATRDAAVQAGPVPEDDATAPARPRPDGNPPASRDLLPVPVAAPDAASPSRASDDSTAPTQLSPGPQGILVPRSIVALTGVLLAGMAVTIGLLLGPTLGGPPEEAAPEPTPTGTKGRFATAPRACGLLTDEQAAEVVPGFQSSEVEIAECNWLNRDWRKPSAEKYDLRVRLVAQKQDGSEINRAKEYFASKKKDTLDKGQLATPKALPPQDMAGVGEEAFISAAYSTINLYGGSYKVTVVFRVSNLIAEVEYERGGVKGDPDGKLAENAGKTARWLAEALQTHG
ncbi:hypothetical protein GCM10010156_43550 [Planobispora rosea]|uniref:Protein kinase domain-containing protein n=1 Tax=Planobispora rosea TaxID=35762 RepID=A0A8J3WDX5_PLARO|nr:hypothetical protein [Planobispora rosea]GGS80041.1 hypothetical protein GCM10010156_43550 [Planobispora rosea]GIH85790.1 hypothetical protein Pro02_41980 [Planobispora rosea]